MLTCLVIYQALSLQLFTAKSPFLAWANYIIYLSLYQI